MEGDAALLDVVKELLLARHTYAEVKLWLLGCLGRLQVAPSTASSKVHYLLEQELQAGRPGPVQAAFLELYVQHNPAQVRTATAGESAAAGLTQRCR